MGVVDPDIERAVALIDVVAPVLLARRDQHRLGGEIAGRQQAYFVARTVAARERRKSPRLGAAERDAEFLRRFAIDHAIGRLRIAEAMMPDRLGAPVLVGVGVEKAL